jgi:hypothetical protein
MLRDLGKDISMERIRYLLATLRVRKPPLDPSGSFLWDEAHVQELIAAHEKHRRPQTQTAGPVPPAA